MSQPDLHRYADIHSHRADMALRGDTVVCIEPGTPMLPGGTYSVGLHPWSTVRPLTLGQLTALWRDASDARCVAVGECGLDALRGGPEGRQEAVFALQARMADRLGKPLIIHCVRRYDRLLALRRSLRPHVEWIIHGFRGKPALARQLLAAGISLSLGPRHNPDTAAIIPEHRRYSESDEG